MSYDIYLIDQISEETIKLPIRHLMIGGTYRADYKSETKTSTPAAIADAWLNITYNYARYYYEAAENDERFYGVGDYREKKHRNLGIRGIYGKTGMESLPMLDDMIARIEMKYKKNGEWISTKRVNKIYRDSDGNTCHMPDVFLHKEKYTEEEIETEVWEGPNDDYWMSTAANALKPLYQLRVFAGLRPDGVWKGD